MSYLNGFGLLFEERFHGTLETCNEICFLYLCYHLVLQANLLEAGAIQDQVGWSFIYTSIAMVAVNLLIVISVTFKALILKLRRKLHKRKLLKHQK